MAYLWIVGGSYYYWHWERKDRRAYENPPRLTEYPRVSIIVPCHNEGDNVADTLTALLNQAYPDFEIIAVNDGSSDSTGTVLDAFAANHERVRALHLAKNQGKAIAMRMGAMLAESEFLVCVDGDALLDPNAVAWIMMHFVSGARVGAVTGNPRIRTRSSLLGKIQVGEFSSIIGLTKRAQRIYGRIFTASGVVTGFRKSALHWVGYWSPDMITDDIDISWNLQMNHWDIRFEPNALCWILMPETLRGLWKQRLRWAQGGAEVLLKYFPGLWSWRKRRMWLVWFELLLSLLWAYVMTSVFILWALGKVVALPESWMIETLLPGWTGVMLGFTCLFQFAVSLAIDSRYEPNTGRYYYWVIWYPMAYWLINVCTAVVALPRAVINRKGGRAVWISPDRGINPERGATP
ncbi:MAG: poly-beta-1,6-N-acetyl-D-glucosamine synthase [Pseudomonadota bacterium]|nr:poly-beta-1,6-N-acetyl-D-glucosamine synthase [Pseudomonadota bacterium]